MNAPPVQARTQSRAMYTQEVRQALLEEDMDHKDREMQELRSELRAIKQILIGIMVSTTGAMIAGAVNFIWSK